MKSTFLALSVLTALAIVAAEPSVRQSAASATANATNRFAVSGMHCDGCARGIASELKRASGVSSASVSFTNKLAIVSYDTNRITAEGLRKVIAEAGYEAKLVKAGNPQTR